MTVAELIRILDGYFPLSTQDSWDNSGLLIGAEEACVEGVLLALDVTQEVIDEAVDRHCNVVLSHHPLIFDGLKRLTTEEEQQRIVVSAIRKNLNIVAIHTPLDKSLEDGTSATLASMIGLRNCRVLIPEFCNGQPVYGYGVIGELEQPLSEEEFLHHLSEKVSPSGVLRTNGLTNRDIERVAICTGSAFEFAEKAYESNADAYITADVKYHLQIHNITEYNKILHKHRWQVTQHHQKRFLQRISSRLSMTSSRYTQKLIRFAH